MNKNYQSIESMESNNEIIIVEKSLETNNNKMSVSWLLEISKILLIIFYFIEFIYWYLIILHFIILPYIGIFLFPKLYIGFVIVTIHILCISLFFKVESTNKYHSLWFWGVLAVLILLANLYVI